MVTVLLWKDTELGLQVYLALLIPLLYRVGSLSYPEEGSVVLGETNLFKPPLINSALIQNLAKTL